MKRIWFWIAISSLLYFCSGWLLPLSLWSEFGCSGFSSGQGFGGLVDYAKLYPHLVLYAPCWSLFAFANLGLAFSLIDGHGDRREKPRLWRGSLIAPLGLFAVIAGYAAYCDAKNPGMMLFEISPSAQKEPVAHYLPTATVPPDLTVAKTVFAGIDGDRGTDSHRMQTVRNSLFSWETTWKQNSKGLSKSRSFYLCSVAGIVWAMIATLVCATFAALMPEKSSERRQTVCASIGAATGLMLWFPHRIYYNAETKTKLFDLSEMPGLFDNWIPAWAKERGLTAVESIPILFVAVVFFIIVVVVLKKDPQVLLKRSLEWLGLLGITGVSLWTAIEPRQFGKVVGLIDGTWDRLIICTLTLMVFFVLYGLFILNPAEPPKQRPGNQ